MSSPTGRPDSRSTPTTGASPTGAPPAAGSAFDKTAQPGSAARGDTGAGSTSPAGAPGSTPAGSQPGAGVSHPAPGFDDKGHVQRGKISAVWVGIIAAAIVLILLIIFIAQNLKEAPIHYLGASGHLAIGLMLLIAVIGGVLLAAIPGTIRILQLRKAVKLGTPKDKRGSDASSRRGRK